MKSITTTTTVYTFQELSDSAKERARQNYRHARNSDTDFAGQVIDDAEQCAKFLGISFSRDRNDLPRVYWSGFSSQGDGACFEGTWSAGEVQYEKLKEHAPTDAKLHQIAKKFQAIAKSFPEASFHVTHSCRYYHEYCTEFDVSDCGDSDRPIKEVAREFMRWIYDQIEREHNYQDSEEVVDEMLLASGYEFIESGDCF